MRRAFHTLLTLLGVSLVVFVLMRVVPGDPVAGHADGLLPRRVDQLNAVVAVGDVDRHGDVFQQRREEVAGAAEFVLRPPLRGGVAEDGDPVPRTGPAEDRHDVPLGADELHLADVVRALFDQDGAARRHHRAFVGRAPRREAIDRRLARAFFERRQLASTARATTAASTGAGRALPGLATLRGAGRRVAADARTRRRFGAAARARSCSSCRGAGARGCAGRHGRRTRRAPARSTGCAAPRPRIRITRTTRRARHTDESDEGGCFDHGFSESRALTSNGLRPGFSSHNGSCPRRLE